MTKKSKNLGSERRNWLAWTSLVIGVSALGAASWMSMPVAFSQAAALGRWTFNSDVTDFSTPEGVEDSAGPPSPTFDGDPAGSISFCSEYSPAVSPPHSGTYSDCMYLSGSNYVAGDKGENLFSGDTGDTTHYTGSRSILAWVRTGSTSWLGNGQDRAIVSLGKDNYGYNEFCDSGDPSSSHTDGSNPHCTGFAMWVDSGGNISAGNTRAGSSTSANGYLIGPTLTCSSTSYNLSSNSNINQWFFVAVTYNSENAQDSDNSDTLDGTSTKIYVNGTLCAKGHIFRPYTEVSTSSRWMIGSFIGLDGEPYSTVYQPRFHGFVDDVRVFDRALPLSEISALYASSNNGG